ncbi:DUF721 domain-containing protein [Gluconacetobacter diazotrophicus]|uniref:DUF721 domain-containing protein n=1 Tax=Gluconacetobacter diazotrophicus (strain ATCC 49037 / DSM 5601 / CCUG 37298 / CIP 103539 / LMG 7603 / PAl5) TaxID=272568 RepID=A9HER3_GLUDA|nr:DUF721 domain-containing protein [Gluconacetobacter diazotrophicus]TWB11137.1 hypothetical protein FBZ86_101164 [Gluconacetobacter diazotrophicus]CAP55268.1 conserved hypothetical protein [Gluconacetobacter diazotrophicus PA1 5]
MTKDGTDGKRALWMRSLGALMPAVTRPAFCRQSPAAAQIMADWADIVGPDLARCTVPRRLSAGVLTLGCAGPVAMELQHLAPELIARINRACGRDAVRSLKLVQDMVPGAPPPPRPARRDPPPPLPIPDMPDGPLKDALGALGARVRERARRT